MAAGFVKTRRRFYMVKEEIVEGLKLAVLKGETLEKAMMSFYNAGYLKEDIEEAAKYASSPQTQSVQQPTKQSIQQSQTNNQIKISSPTTKNLDNLTKNQKLQQVQTQSKTQPQVQQKPKTQQPEPRPIPILQQSTQQTKPIQPVQQATQTAVVQRVSDYNFREKPSKTITIILIALLVLLVGTLFLIYYFIKGEVSEILNVAG